MVPEPFTWMPADQRAVCIPDGSITSAFLDLFGRPPRDTGLLSERNDQPTSAQRLHLLNSTHIQSKLTGSEKLRALFRSNPAPRDAIQQLYLTILSRYPTDQEMGAIARLCARRAKPRGGRSGTTSRGRCSTARSFAYRH